MEEWRLAKTDSRSILGTVNELSRMARFHEAKGDFEGKSLSEISLFVRIPVTRASRCHAR